jgi:RNA polymerase sigma-70 factor, ECF subfamily
LTIDQDILLVQQVASGSRDAFDTIFRKYYSPLCRFAYLFTADQGDAEEMVQTAFITFWENKTHIHISKSLKAYLYQMVRNNALMHIRKTNTRKQYEQEFAERAEESPEERPYTDEDINKLILKGMEMLPEKCRMIFSLSRYDGLSYEEIAEYLEISPKTVENQMGLAFQKLRNFLSPSWKKMLFLLGGMIWRIISS